MRKGPEPVRTVNEHATEHAQANDRRRLCDADRMTPGDPRLRNGTGTDVKRPTFQRPASISPCICIRAGRSGSPIYRSSGEQCAGLNVRRCGGVDCIVGEHHWTGDVNSRVATRSGCSCHTLTQLGIPSAISSRLLSERQKLFIAYSTFSAHPVNRSEPRKLPGDWPSNVAPRSRHHSEGYASASSYPSMPNPPTDVHRRSAEPSMPTVREIKESAIRTSPRQLTWTRRDTSVGIGAISPWGPARCVSFRSLLRAAGA